MLSECEIFCSSYAAGGVFKSVLDCHQLKQMAFNVQDMKVKVKVGGVCVYVCITERLSFSLNAIKAAAFSGGRGQLLVLGVKSGRGIFS